MDSTTATRLNIARARGTQRLARALRSPGAWHVASLVLGFVFIMWLQRGQWFFLDEWAFLEPNHLPLMDPHVGHWSTAPLAIFLGYRTMFGMGSYFPFALTVTLIHLAIVHLTWRLSLRSHVDPWIATTSVSILLVLGAGAENILWGFQTGFLGALALGMLAFLLATRTHVSVAGHIGIIAVSVFALTWSGTSIPLVMATAVMIWRRSGLPRAGGYAFITGLVYLSWYAVFALGSATNPDTGGLGLEKLFIKIPQFLGVMLILGTQRVFPIPGMGALVMLLLLVWLIRLRRARVSIAGFAPALILTAAAAAFALMTAYSRAEFSLGGGRASRYVYLLVVLLLPLCGVAMTRLAHRGRRTQIGIVAGLLALTIYQGAVLHNAAQDQAAREQESKRLLSAAISLSINEPGSVNLDAVPDTQWAPDVTLRDIVELHDEGILPLSEFGPVDVERARATITAAG